MAYDDSRFRGEPGFRDEPDFQHENALSDATTLSGGESASGQYPPASYSLAGYSGTATDQTEGTVNLTPGGVTQAQLDDVFDDPAHGEPGRDRMAVHAVWEVLLLLAVAGTWYLLRRADPASVRGAALRDLMVSAAALGFVTAGIGLSLRAAAVNLAVGPVAVATGLFFADHVDRGTASTAVVSTLLATAVGVALAALVVGFHVPGWAASLAVAFAVIVWIQLGEDIKLDDAYRPTRHAAYWFLAFVVIALLGSVLGAARPIRRAVGRFRPVGDPARRRGAAAAALTTLAIAGSCALGGVGGILMALHARAAVISDNGLGLAGLALGLALVGGTSAYGRRGGLFGTVFAVVLIVLVIRYAEVTDRRVAPLAFAAGAIALGLVVTRLVETFGRPRSAVEEEADGDWTGGGGSPTIASDSGWSSRSGGWTSPLPARTGDDGWGRDDRWGGR